MLQDPFSIYGWNAEECCMDSGWKLRASEIIIIVTSLGLIFPSGFLLEEWRKAKLNNEKGGFEF